MSCQHQPRPPRTSNEAARALCSVHLMHNPFPVALRQFVSSSSLTWGLSDRTIFDILVPRGRSRIAADVGSTGLLTRGRRSRRCERCECTALPKLGEGWVRTQDAEREKQVKHSVAPTCGNSTPIQQSSLPPSARLFPDVLLKLLMVVWCLTSLPAFVIVEWVLSAIGSVHGRYRNGFVEKFEYPPRPADQGAPGLLSLLDGLNSASRR